MNLSPIIVEALRGQNSESVHIVSAVVVNSANIVKRSWGNIDLKMYPRSSIKAIQAVALFVSGAAQKFKLTELELALASASHSGEPAHIEVVEHWLKRLNLSVQDLECGTHFPSSQSAGIQLLKNGRDFSALHNNCSGKHTGMLAVALALGEPTKGYVNSQHAVQKMIRTIIEDFSGVRIEESAIATDGCSIPTHLLSLKASALAMARFSDAAHFSEKYREACESIFKANVENPFYIAGTDRYCTNMMKELKQRVLVKTGAEGVMFASIPELKTGIAVKVHDGATRAAEMAMSYILKELGLLSPSSWEKFSQISIKNWNNILTGSVRIRN